MAMIEEVQILKSLDDISLEQFTQSLGEVDWGGYWYLFLIRFEVWSKYAKVINLYVAINRFKWL